MPSPAPVRPVVVVAGASGLVGRPLCAALAASGWDVRRLVRRGALAPDEIGWDPEKGLIQGAGLAGAAAVINLAGENIGAGRWTAARRRAIRESRLQATRTLVAAARALPQPPLTWINASAVGYYGDTGDATVDERSPVGRGFLAEVCADWEREALGAEAWGARLVCVRLGVVLDAHGGALAKMLPIFRLGLGGPVGSGRQWMSWISSEDVAGVIRRALTDPGLRGPVNAVAPEAVTNAAFTRALARVLRRPAFLPVPAFALRLLFGEMGEATVLASTRADPGKLKQAGYPFRHPTLEGALVAALRERS